jgi:nucleotide-binding universal stress UspA family protein
MTNTTNTSEVVPVQRIVVGVDHSEGSRRALEWALDEARLRGARVEVVHAWSFPYLPTGPFVSAPLLSAEQLEADARVVLDASIAEVDVAGLAEPVEPVLVCDGPANALLERSKGADLLVVGSRGRGGFTGLLLGSVSQAVSQHAPCPVVIVPRAR